MATSRSNTATGVTHKDAGWVGCGHKSKRQCLFDVQIRVHMVGHVSNWYSTCVAPATLVCELRARGVNITEASPHSGQRQSFGRIWHVVESTAVDSYLKKETNT